MRRIGYAARFARFTAWDRFEAETSRLAHSGAFGYGQRTRSEVDKSTACCTDVLGRLIAKLIGAECDPALCAASLLRLGRRKSGRFIHIEFAGRARWLAAIRQIDEAMSQITGLAAVVDAGSRHRPGPAT